jgi:uncharacterized protein with PIN domain
VLFVIFVVKNKFVADVMLGRLARFMRFAGYDVEYDRSAKDDDLFQRSRYRILLTRDRELVARAAKRKVYFVQTTGAENQLEEIRRLFPLQNGTPRCLLCNYPIRKVKKEIVRHLVPPFIYRSQSDFFRCKKCGKIYWKGTHFERMSRVIQFSAKSNDR